MSNNRRTLPVNPYMFRRNQTPGLKNHQIRSFAHYAPRFLQTTKLSLCLLPRYISYHSAWAGFSHGTTTSRLPSGQSSPSHAISSWGTRTELVGIHFAPSEDHPIRNKQMENRILTNRRRYKRFMIILSNLNQL